MMRAVVIASQAARTLMLMSEDGPSFSVVADVAGRAHLGTFAASAASLLVNQKWLVADHETVEIGAKDIGIEQGSGAFHYSHHPFLSLLHLFCYPSHFLLCQCYFFLFAFRCIGMHKRKADIGFGHDERVGTICVASYLFQFLIEDGDSLSDVIAAGAQRITEMSVVFSL